MVYGATNANARIVLRAVFDAWVQIRDADDALLLTKVLRQRRRPRACRTRPA